MIDHKTIVNEFEVIEQLIALASSPESITKKFCLSGERFQQSNVRVVDSEHSRAPLSESHSEAGF
jgi:hypothetical protein